MKIQYLVPVLFSLSVAQAADRLTYFAPIDVKSVHDQEVLREIKGEAPRFAIPHQVAVSPALDQSWEKSVEGYTWTHRVKAPNAVSLNFGFTQFRLPEGARLVVRATDGSEAIRPFTAEDNNVNDQLWTPVIMSDDVTIELTVPADAVSQVRFEMGHVGQGFRTFAQKTAKSGSCNIDVACEDSRGWSKEVASVAVISTGGSTFCTGFMVNNAKNDKTPFFMTANHCGISASRAPSLVVYWNYQASTCGGPRDGKLNQFQSGSTFLAANATSDFTLVRLNSAPKAEWNVGYAGWDRSGQNALVATAIHHPATDEKAISFEFDGTDLTTYLGSTPMADGTHVRVKDWDRGTTEPGSSGSPLFNQDHRVIGQLHGGWAACGNDDADYYGAFHKSWEGGGTASTRLKDHLDPDNTGVMFVDSI